MPLVDTWVTQAVLDPSKFTHGTNTVVQDTHRAGRAVGDLHGRTMSMVGALGGYARSIAIGIGGLAVTIAGLGIYAMKTAADFDTLERTLTAVTGSAQRAKDILSFVDELSVPSIFSSQDLADAAKTLEAFGLATETYLPIVEKLGTVFGGTSDKLDQFVRALGFIKAGRFGEAFEALASAGISRKMITAAGGGEFNQGGEFLGNVDSALSAVEKLVKDKYGRLADEMASGPTARLASAWDQVQRGIRQTGAELLKGFLPYLDMATDIVGGWVKDGTFANIGKTIASWFKPTGPIVQGVISIAAWLSEIPDMIDIIRFGFLSIVNDALVPMVNMLIDGYNHLVAWATVLNNIAGAIGGPAGSAALHSWLGDLPQARHVSGVDNPSPIAGAFDPGGKAKGWSDALQDAYDKNSRKGTSAGASGGKSEASSAVNTLENIADNTRELVDINKRQLSLQEGALGGGTIGRIGLTGREMVTIRRRGGMAPVAG